MKARFEIYDLPQDNETMIATFADDTAMLAIGEDAVEANSKLQKA